MKYIILISLLSLSACNSAAEQDTSITMAQANLPRGCTLSFAGDVSVAGTSHPAHIFVTQCGTTTTTSTTRTVDEGKVTRGQTDVVVNTP
jgi:hypothetical protein